MLFVAAASAASSPCAGSSLFFCEDFGAGRDGWVEGRGDAKQFASHKHPWPSNTHKADDAGVLLDRRLGAGVLGKALPKAVRMDEVPLSLSFELTGVNAFDEEEREVGMLLHPWKQKQRRAKVERSKHVFDDRDAPFWEKEDQTIAYWIYASAGVVLLAILLLLCAPAKPEDDDEKRD